MSKIQTKQNKIIIAVVSAVFLVAMIVVAASAASSRTDEATSSQTDTTTASTAEISLEEARLIAFADAGCDEKSVEMMSAQEDTEDGIRVYEIEFIYNGREYEYEIVASDARIYSKKAESVLTTAIPTETQGNTVPTVTQSTADDTTSTSTAAQNRTTTLDEAKKTALDDAGVSASEVVFTKSKLEKDNGVDIYEIEFYTSAHAYEYEISVNSGKIIKKNSKANTDSDVVATTKQDDTSTRTTAADEQKITLSRAKSIALKHAGISADKAEFTKAKKDYEDGILIYDIEFISGNTKYEYEIAVYGGKVIKSEKEHSDHSANTNESTNNIGIEKAKKIALSHAGLSDSQVSFSKVKLDHEDGRAIYEIEFVSGKTEYEYEIDAQSGSIIDFEKDT